MHSGCGGEAAPRVMVLAATNYPWQIDEALRRWGPEGLRVGGWLPVLSSSRLVRQCATHECAW